MSDPLTSAFGSINPADITREHEPEGTVIFHVPHASRLIPPEVRTQITLDDHELAAELDEITDAATDFIADYSAHRSGVKPLILRNTWSRLVVDPERFPDDREELNAVGRGAVYTRTCSGKPMRAEDPERDEQLISRYYDPYARRLTELVDARLEEYGSALIVDMHSYPREASEYELHKAAPRPEICIGVDDHHTPTWLRDLAVEKFAEYGFTDVAINVPFAGAYIPLKHYRTDERVLGLMIEIRRDVYIDDQLQVTDRGVARLGKAIGAVVEGAVQHLNGRGGRQRQMSTNHHEERPKLPDGLTYCEICGEPKGIAIDESIELFEDETDEDRTLKVSCYCDAITCVECGQQTRHRPISDYYDVDTEKFVHVPHLAAKQPCRDCRRGPETKTSRFYYHSLDGVIGRKNDDGSFDSLMPDGTWRRNVPTMDEFVCAPVERSELNRVAAKINIDGDSVDFDAPPVDIVDPETDEIVPFTDSP